MTKSQATTDETTAALSQLTTEVSKYDTYAAEIAAMQHKIDRLERMIQYLATKAGVTLSTLESL
ncbi:MAG: hypothetical protein WAQ25_04310 [Candidatus Saccharimonas sp.]